MKPMMTTEPVEDHRTARKLAEGTMSILRQLHADGTGAGFLSVHRDGRVLEMDL